MPNPYPAEWIDTSRVERLTGEIKFTDPGNQPGAGSAAGSMLSWEALFTQEATPGVYSASLPVLAGTVVMGVTIYGLAVWLMGNGDTFSFDMGDTLGGAGSYIAGQDFSGMDAYSPVNFAYSQYGSTGKAITLSLANAGVYSMCDTVYDGLGGAVDLPAGVRYPSDDTITVAITLTSSNPPVVPTGLMLVKVLYFAPITPVAASFA